jgi:hypothetical protein
MVEEDFVACPECESPAQKTTDPDTNEVRIHCPDCGYESLNGVEIGDDFLTDFGYIDNYDEDDKEFFLDRYAEDDYYED